MSDRWQRRTRAARAHAARCAVLSDDDQSAEQDAAAQPAPLTRSRAPHGWRHRATARRRPDGTLKVTGQFAYGSDLWMDGMIWGATLRSPHPSARITSISIGAALATAGVYAVLTHDDVPGTEPIRPRTRRPAGAGRGRGPLPGRAGRHRRRRSSGDRAPGRQEDPGRLRGAGAGHRRRSRRWTPGAPRLSSGRQPGPPPQAAQGRSPTPALPWSWSRGLPGRHAGPGVPRAGGRAGGARRRWRRRPVRRDSVAARRPAPDLRGARPAAGAGQADPGRGRRRVRRPRGPVHARARVPAGAAYRQAGEDELQPRGVVLRPRAPAPGDDALRARRDAATAGWSTSRRRSSWTAAPTRPARRPSSGTRAPWASARTSCRTCMSTPTACTPTTRRAARCAASARCRPRSRYEAQMDKLAAALGLDPVELRCLQRHEPGRARRRPARSWTAPRRWLSCCDWLERRAGCRSARTRGGQPDLLDLPGGAANTTHGEGVKRGVGYAVAYKNVGFSEGFDDYSTARVRLEVSGGEPTVTVHTAAAEVGQGLVTIEQQICRTELGVQHVVSQPEGHLRRLGRIHLRVPADLRDRRRGPGRLPAGPRPRCSRWPSSRLGHTVADLRLADGQRRLGQRRHRWCRSPTCSATRPSRRPCSGGTGRPTRSTRRPGQGFAHVQYAFAAHRAVVDVDTELGLVKVVELACAQDVGKAMNPDAVLGQIHGGSAQGLGLAIMEEIQVKDGRIREPVVYRLPDPHHPGHAADARRRARVPRPACPLRAARRRRAADHLVRARHRGRHPGGHRPGSDPDPDQARAPHRHCR